jgi:hypothetical protein
MAASYHFILIILPSLSVFIGHYVRIMEIPSGKSVGTSVSGELREGWRLQLFRFSEILGKSKSGPGTNARHTGMKLLTS